MDIAQLQYQKSIFVIGLAVECVLVTFSETKNTGEGSNPMRGLPYLKLLTIAGSIF